MAPFPPIGGGQFQIVNIRVSALGAAGSGCHGSIGFRSVPAGDPVGPSADFTLQQGEMKAMPLLLGTLGIGAAERAEVHPSSNSPIRIASLRSSSRTA